MLKVDECMDSRSADGNIHRMPVVDMRPHGGRGIAGRVRSVVTEVQPNHLIFEYPIAYSRAVLSPRGLVLKAIHTFPIYYC